MTKKAIFWISFGGAAMTIALGAVVFAIVVMFYDPFLPKKLTDYYSDDAHFHRYRGLVLSVSEKRTGRMTIGSVEPLEEDIRSPEPYKLGVLVFSPDIETTWAHFNPSPGLRFEFTASFAIFYDGYPGVIVQLSVGEEEILPYQEGKEALLEWAKQQH